MAQKQLRKLRQISMRCLHALSRNHVQRNNSPENRKAMVTSDLIGSSPQFKTVLDKISMVAAVNCAVLIFGETGTGKEMIAQAIHDTSPRRHKPFVALNCAAIPNGLLESELFGHERGAFTGAVTKTIGRFEAAEGGTLFLDEIGDLPLELQPKLLRVLQEQQFERLGGLQTLQVDVRVIAATNQDLWSMVRERDFRADLYYRLNVFPIELPLLRERVVDIPLLVEHFIRKFARRQGKTIDHVPHELMEALKRHDWPGNIRELQNVIERAVIMTSGTDLNLPFDDFKKMVQRNRPSEVRTFAEAQWDHIIETLRQVDWVIGGRRGAAIRLGLPRTTLISRMCKLGIIRRTAPVFASEASSLKMGEGMQLVRRE
jgi:formate hydrogenlyase transcriptional activator